MAYFTMTSEQKILYKTIDEILFNDWDPIGVNEFEDARDEYHDYVSEIIILKISGADKDTIASHLLKIETDIIGLFGNLDNCKRVADKILSV